jgi:N-carbamoylputrescine amidase
MVCFGETFLQGFDTLTWNYETDQKTAMAVDSPIISGRYIRG